MDCKLAWLCLLRLGSALLLVAEQLAEVRTKKPHLFTQRFASRANALNNNSERVGGTKDGAEAVPGRVLAACGAVRCEARGWQSHSMLT